MNEDETPAAAVRLREMQERARACSGRVCFVVCHCVVCFFVCVRISRRELTWALLHTLFATGDACVAGCCGAMRRDGQTLLHAVC